MSGRLETQCGFVSEKGRRESNQDFLAYYFGTKEQRDLQGTVAVIADGMGSTSGGRFAAEITARGFIDGYYGQKQTLGVDRAADCALSAINRWIFGQARQDSKLRNAGTTFTALVLRGCQSHIIHVGDTRIYRLRDGRLQPLTTDHIHEHPDMQHVLTRAVGLDETLCIDYSAHNLNLHDRFLLCCDGIHTVLSDSKITALLRQHKSPQNLAQLIVKAALRAGTTDNASAMVVDVLNLPPPDQSYLEMALDELPIIGLPNEGDCIDGFRLESILSDSRYTRVFRATSEIGEHPIVVLKFPKPDITSETVYREAFVRERWITTHIQNPSVVEQIELDAGRQTRLYSIMPYYHGETLEQFLLRQPVTLNQGVNIAIRLAKAVYSLHRCQIIHRDIKPDNVMLLEDGGLKLLDLGVSRLPGLKDGLEETAPGTPSYMAPELFSGNQGDERSDLYALGVTIYRMFSGGSYPYGEVEPFTRPRFDKFAPLSKYRADLPSWLNAVVTKATHADRRFNDAMDLAVELENGLIRGQTTVPLETSFYERNSVRFWQIVSLILFSLLLSLLLV